MEIAELALMPRSTLRQRQIKDRCLDRMKHMHQEAVAGKVGKGVDPNKPGSSP